jgi:hypothetical protein
MRDGFSSRPGEGDRMPGYWDLPWLDNHPRLFLKFCPSSNITSCGPDNRSKE